MKSRIPVAAPWRRARRTVRMAAANAAVIIAATAISIADGEAGAQPDEPTVAQIEAAAIAQDPAISTIRARIEAEIASGASARRAWPQPVLSYQAFILPVETRQGPQRHVIGVSQMFPWIRALEQAELVSAERAEALRHELSAAAIETSTTVRLALLDILEVDEELEIIQEKTQLYRDLGSFIQDTIAHGDATNADLYRTTLRTTMLEDRAARLSAARAEASERLRVLVALEGSEQIGPLPTADDPLLGLSTDVPSTERLLEAARSRNPRVQGALQRAHAGRERAELVEYDLWPRPTVRAGWSVVGQYDQPLPGTGDGGRDALFVGLSVPIPVARGANQAQIESTLASASAEEHRANDIARDLSDEIARAIVRIEDARDRLARFSHTILLLAADLTQESLRALPHGQESFADYLLAFEDELRLELLRVEARFDMARDLIRINGWTAGAIDRAAGVDSPLLGLIDDSRNDSERPSASGDDR